MQSGGLRRPSQSRPAGGRYTRYTCRLRRCFRNVSWTPLLRPVERRLVGDLHVVDAGFDQHLAHHVLGLFATCFNLGKNFQIQLALKFSGESPVRLAPPSNDLTETVLALNRNKTRPRRRKFPSPRATGKSRFTFNQSPSATVPSPPTTAPPAATFERPPPTSGKSGS